MTELNSNASLRDVAVNNCDVAETLMIAALRTLTAVKSVASRLDEMPSAEGHRDEMEELAAVLHCSSDALKAAFDRFQDEHVESFLLPCDSEGSPCR